MVEEAENKSKISIWWDIENCHVPKDVDPHYIAQNMTAALQHANLTGPIEIQVFGDTMILPPVTQRALSDTGITLNHVPRGNKDAADKAILVAMLLWALDNPPPANILLISGDGDFANALHRLRHKTYSILLAVPPQFVKPALTGAAKKLWFWKDMAKGHLAEPEPFQQPSSQYSLQEPAGSHAMDAFQKRQLSASFNGSTIHSSTYASPQKRMSTAEHFRSMSLENYPNSCSTSGISFNNRSRSSGMENTHSVPSDMKVSLGGAGNTSSNNSIASISNGRPPVGNTSSSNNTNASIIHVRPPVPAARSMDLGQYPHFLPQAGGRVDSLPSTALCNNSDCPKPPQFTNASAGPLPRGPLEHIAPNKNRGVNNVPFVRNAFPENKYSQNVLIPSNASTEHIDFQGLTPPNRLTASSAPAVVADDAEKLSHNICLDKIYSAMKTLERDMLAPTESNLLGCIKYWDSQHEKVDVRQTLKLAADLQQITKTQLGGGLIMYFPPQHRVPWACVDPGNMNVVHSEDVWRELQRFLSYGEKKQAFLSSCSRYNAALIVKSSCGTHIHQLVAGNILNLLQQAIQERKWLRKTGPGWGPLILNQKVLLDWSGGKSLKADSARPSSNQGGPVSVRKLVASASTERALDKDVVFTKLQSFLSQTLKDGNALDLCFLPKEFELATGIPLDHQKLGYTNLLELVKDLSDVVYVETTNFGLLLLRLVKVGSISGGLVNSSRAEKENGGESLRQAQLVQELKTWLSYTMSTKKDGYDITRIHQDFQQATGKDLSKEGVDFIQLQIILKQFADVVLIAKSPGGLWLAFPR